MEDIPCKNKYQVVKNFSINNHFYIALCNSILKVVTRCLDGGRCERPAEGITIIAARNKIYARNGLEF